MALLNLNLLHLIEAMQRTNCMISSKTRLFTNLGQAGIPSSARSPQAKVPGPAAHSFTNKPVKSEGAWSRTLCWVAEVNISSYPATSVAGLFFFCRAEILNSGGFMQKYSDEGSVTKSPG